MSNLDTLKQVQIELYFKYGDVELDEYSKGDLIKIVCAMGEVMIDNNNQMKALHSQITGMRSKKSVIIQ